jgi:hypothetical protein
LEEVDALLKKLLEWTHISYQLSVISYRLSDLSYQIWVFSSLMTV